MSSIVGFFESDKTNSNSNCEHLSLGPFQVKVSNDRGSCYSHFESEDFIMILNGNIYKYDDIPLTSNELFHKISRNITDISNILSRIDGYFSCVGYSKKTNQIYIINDRWGLSPMYVYKSENKITSWSTGLKEIVEKSNINLTYDKDAILAYVENLHFLSDRTQYQEIRRVKPASIIILDEGGDIISEDIYWKWNDIKPIKISFNDAVDQLYKLFIESVDLRVSVDKDYCLTLSGGLDSRALVGALNHLKRENVTCLSFGIPDSPDVKIAAEVSKRAGYKHKVVDININNWIDGRDNGVSNSGGMKSIFHMHVMNSQINIEQVSKYVINGYLGDLVLGGGYLKKNTKGMVTVEESLISKFGFYSSQIDCQDPYFEHASSDPVYIYNRGVRFTSMGTDIVSDTLVNIKPFMDNRLLEFVYSLNDEYRYNGKLYHSMLLKYFPELFSDIPWQSTGKIIKARSKDSILSEMYLKVRPKLISLVDNSKMNMMVRRIHRMIMNSDTFVDYNSWIKGESFKPYLDVLLDDNCVVKGIIGKKVLDEYLSDALENGKIEPLGCLVSLELFLLSVSKK